MKDSEKYRSLGVSSAKEDIVAASLLQGKGLFRGAFCKIIEDVFTGDPDYCVAFHADGAGTKSIVAYLLYRELEDPTLFASLAQDALVMNIDDLLCIGARGPFVVTNTIGRHRELIPSAAIKAIIQGYEECVHELSRCGVELHLCGGETADLGDLVRTIVVDASVAVRLRRDQVIEVGAIRPNDVIIGLSSSGKADYEDRINSGIGSNGLTLARHALLKNEYCRKFPESLAPELPQKIAYRGPYGVTDEPEGLGMSIGQALLSPTRSYAPIVVRLIKEFTSSRIHGIVHCTGGGQTKCLRFGPSLAFIKDNLFDIPPLFKLIQKTENLDWKEMYQVFNMGHRMEIFVEPSLAQDVIDVAGDFGVGAQVIGRCKSWNPKNKSPQLVIEGPMGTITFGNGA